MIHELTSEDRLAVVEDILQSNRATLQRGGGVWHERICRNRNTTTLPWEKTNG